MNGENMTVREKFGVNKVPMLDINIHHCVPPHLHCLIGTVNNVLDNLIDEMQAAMEVYSERHVMTEEAFMKARTKAKAAKLERDTFLLHNLECERHWKGVMKSRDASVEEKESAEAEIQFLNAEGDVLRTKLKTAKEEEKTLKAAFNEDANATENSKLKGQPVRAKIEDVMRKVGVDRGDYYGRKLEGPGCRKMMAKRVKFEDVMRKVGVDRGDYYGRKLEGPGCQKMMAKRVKFADLPSEHVASTGSESKNDTNEKIVMTIQIHCRLLGHLHALFSLLRTPRFHTNGKIVDHLKKHRDHILALVRHLRMSVTHKCHNIEAHIVHAMTQTGGFDDIAEDAGERAHQDGARMNRRVHAIPNVQKKESTIARCEAMEQNSIVAVKSEEIRSRQTKRKTHCAGNEQLKKMQ